MVRRAHGEFNERILEREMVFVFGINCKKKQKRIVCWRTKRYIFIWHTHTHTNYMYRAGAYFSIVLSMRVEGSRLFASRNRRADELPRERQTDECVGRGNKTQVGNLLLVICITFSHCFLFCFIKNFRRSTMSHVMVAAMNRFAARDTRALNADGATTVTNVSGGVVTQNINWSGNTRTW